MSDPMMQAIGNVLKSFAQISADETASPRAEVARLQAEVTRLQKQQPSVVACPGCGLALYGVAAVDGVCLVCRANGVKSRSK